MCPPFLFIASLKLENGLENKIIANLSKLVFAVCNIRPKLQIDLDPAGVNLAAMAQIDRGLAGHHIALGLPPSCRSCVTHLSRAPVTMMGEPLLI